MAAGWPTKVTYANGDVFSASDINDTNGTLNYIDPTSATDGQVLTRDNASAGKVKWAASSVATSLGFTAGKNRIINGDFSINQRAFTSTTTSGAYGQDRFYNLNSNGTTTYSAQTFTPGTAPVTGYESTNFARIVSTGQTLSSAFSVFGQKIEDVRTFANQTVTFSFWAKAASGTPSISANFFQDFGGGGSSGVYSYPTTQKQAITTSWARYSFTTTIASMTGKTIGTGSFLAAWIWTSAGSDFNTQTGSLGIQSATIDIWGVQVEAGSTATAFQTATGTIQGELAACQRYYVRHTAGSSYTSYAAALCRATTSVHAAMQLPVQMRIAPTSVDYSTIAVLSSTGSVIASTALVLDYAGTQNCFITVSVASGLTVGNASLVVANGSTSAYIALNAEL
jgi:hypothetical protein